MVLQNPAQAKNPTLLNVNVHIVNKLLHNLTLHRGLMLSDGGQMIAANISHAMRCSVAIKQNHVLMPGPLGMGFKTQSHCARAAR